MSVTSCSHIQSVNKISGQGRSQWLTLQTNKCEVFLGEVLLRNLGQSVYYSVCFFSLFSLSLSCSLSLCLTLPLSSPPLTLFLRRRCYLWAALLLYPLQKGRRIAAGLRWIDFSHPEEWDWSVGCVHSVPTKSLPNGPISCSLQLYHLPAPKAFVCKHIGEWLRQADSLVLSVSSS